MLFALIGILLGIALGWFLPFTIPVEYTRYTAVIILGIMDSLVGAIRAQLTNANYDPWLLLQVYFSTYCFRLELLYSETCSA